MNDVDSRMALPIGEIKRRGTVESDRKQEDASCNEWNAVVADTTPTVGDIIDIAGVYQVNPRSRRLSGVPRVRRRPRNG
jgi:hypothetical protein